MTDSRPTIFFDTNFIKGVSFGDDKWVELLKKSQKNEIRLITHEIVIDEWKANAKQELKKTYKDSKIKSTIAEINKIWGYATKTYNVLEEENEYETIIDYKDLYEEGKGILINYLTNGIDKFILKFKIECLPIDSHDADSVFKKYFDIQLPFKEKSHKENIPDAFIIERALSIQGDNTYYFCKDVAFINTLIERGVSEEKIFNQDSFVNVPILSGNDNAPNSSQVKEVPIKTLKEIHDKNSQEQESLNDRISGYIFGFQQIDEDSLIEILRKKGYAESAIRICIYELIESKIIKKLGNIYIPFDKESCQKSYDKIQDDIIEMIGGSDG